MDNVEVGHPIVYILGAGASATLGAPLVSNFLAKGFDILNEEHMKNSVPNFRKFLREISSGYGQPDIEEVLSFVDLAIAKDQPVSENYSVEKLKQIRGELNYFIYYTLAQSIKTEGFWPRLLGITRDPHHILANNLAPGDAVISFNYDLLIDYAMIARCPYWNIAKGGYGGIEFDIWTHAFGKGEGEALIEGRPIPSAVQLFKLHGSLNWLSCPNCGAFIALWPDLTSFICKGEDYQPSIVCLCKPWDKAPRMSLVLIPPTWVKSYQNKLISNLWENAFNALREAVCIVFIGYSMRDSDVEARYLLRKALMKRATKPQIIVVNSNSSIKEKFEKLFRKLTFYRMTFDEYIVSDFYGKLVNTNVSQYKPVWHFVEANKDALITGQLDNPFSVYGIQRGLLVERLEEWLRHPLRKNSVLSRALSLLKDEENFFGLFEKVGFIDVE